MQDGDGSGSVSGSPADFEIDRIDAKTLNLCVESITSLMNEDVQAFMKLPLSERINVFR